MILSFLPVLGVCLFVEDWRCGVGVAARTAGTGFIILILVVVWHDSYLEVVSGPDDESLDDFLDDFLDRLFFFGIDVDDCRTVQLIIVGGADFALTKKLSYLLNCACIISISYFPSGTIYGIVLKCGVERRIYIFKYILFRRTDVFIRRDCFLSALSVRSSLRQLAGSRFSAASLLSADTLDFRIILCR